MTHGSRDPRPQAGLEQVARLFSEQLGLIENNRAIAQSTNTLFISSVWYPQVGTATLELAPVPLSEQIRQFASTVIASGCYQVQVVPLFLLPGVHVMQDIPNEIAIAQSTLGNSLKINQCPFLGSHPQVADLIIQRQQTLTAEAWILVSHGSRHPGGNQPVEELAVQLGAKTAYWSVENSLAQQVTELRTQGYRRIGILPYFLFSGSITDAIAQQAVQLQSQFPDLYLDFGTPIEGSQTLVNLILDLIEV